VAAVNFNLRRGEPLYNYQGERRRYALPKKAPNWRANNRLGPPTLFHLYCYAKEINSL